MVTEPVSMGQALEITLFSMVIVFISLLVISLILSLFKVVFYNRKDKVRGQVEQKPQEKVAHYPKIIEGFNDDIDLVAALTAVIAASEGQRNSNFKIKSIKRIS